MTNACLSCQRVVLLSMFLVADAVIGLSIWLPYRREQQIIHEIQGWKAKFRSESMESNWLETDGTWVRLFTGAERVKVFDRVTEVWCSNSPVTDEGVLRLTGLKDLKCLGLGRTHISDSALSHVRTMTNLESLYLDRTGVSDAGLAHLQRMTTLRKLSLADTAVSDVGMGYLSGLTNLEILWLNHTRVTDAGYAALKTALPECRIDR